MAEFTKTELETMLKDTEEHLAETMRLGPGYYRIRERYDYAIESDERYIEKLRKQIAEYDQNQLEPEQLLVLNWIKDELDRNKELKPFGVLSVLFDEAHNRSLDYDVLEAMNSLTTRQQLEVLEVFVECELKEVAE
ncbi:hypothetical protein [Enterococcus gilvus]|uniref:hypothetical protein n=1 Tax=Enterococcus gilvus TaxID=160453 RepID=UPI003EDAC85B